MLIKTLVVIAFLSIIISLGSALYHLVRRGDQQYSEKTAKALTLRIGLSILLFIFIFIVYASGLVKPTGIGSRIHPTPIEQSVK